MQILVVKTCDGDCYFKARSRAGKAKAMNLAVEQILNNDYQRWDNINRAEVLKLQGDGKKLFAYLVRIGAITIRTIEE